ncbi:MAG: [Bacteroidales bacterium]|nr:[FeFe] hydrogenase H-cluster maturation GTPase HydF [Bacteroidales bacterium]
MVKVRNIGVFGRRNTGKSTLVNLLTGQEVSIVSPIAGTTTDAVRKRMEIPEIGPCNIIDTAGVDDTGTLGEQRVKKTGKIINEVDMAILVFSGNMFAKDEKDLLEAFRKNDLPVLVVHNQSDILPLDVDLSTELNSLYGVDVVEFSCCLFDEEAQKEALEQLISFIIKVMYEAIRKNEEKTILHGLVNKGDKIVLVCPVDSEAPQGRLILPQVMAIRDVLDNRGVAVVLQPSELEQYLLENLGEKRGETGNVKLVVTDSQAFKEVAGIVDRVEAESAASSGIGGFKIPLTSFSILMARAKGPFDEYLKGIAAIDALKDGDNVLILESCTHHTTCEDIGRVKIPRGLQRYTAERIAAASGNDRGDAAPVKLNFEFVSGLDEIPLDTNYALAVQCGGCMVTRKQLCNRIKRVTEKNIPVVNYGMLLAHLSGIAQRALKPVTE